MAYNFVFAFLGSICGSVIMLVFCLVLGIAFLWADKERNGNSR